MSDSKVMATVLSSTSLRTGSLLMPVCVSMCVLCYNSQWMVVAVILHPFVAVGQPKAFHGIAKHKLL